MSRITKKLDKEHNKVFSYVPDIYGYNNPSDDAEKDLVEAFNKLGQLEDLEEELGIDLITLFKVFVKDDCIYCKYNGKTFYCLTGKMIFWMWSRGYYFYTTKTEPNEIPLNLKDYGKTWALTKEELDD